MSRSNKRREAKLAARIIAANAPRPTGKTERLHRRQLGKLRDVERSSRELESVRRDAPDMQSPYFWRKVWER